jgi:hypothetical protein
MYKSSSQVEASNNNERYLHYEIEDQIESEE